VPTYVRVTESFNPAAAFELEHPGWTVIQTQDLSNSDELFLPSSHTVLVDASACGMPWALAHVAAHLDLEHHLDCCDGFTDEQEREASWLAALRMDYRFVVPPTDPLPHVGFHALEDFPMDGPPTVAL
jgi:hypothetical protein